MSRGFTLPEILIVMMLSVLTGTLLIGILINNSELVYKQSSRVSQGLEINDTLSNIKSYIRQASSVASSYPQTPPATYTSNSSQLVLKFASLDANDDIIQNSFDYVVYLKDEDKLRILVLPDPQSFRDPKDSILAKNVDSLIFDYYDSAGVSTTPTVATRVKVSVVLKQKAGSKVEINTATAEAILRND